MEMNIDAKHPKWLEWSVVLSLIIAAFLVGSHWDLAGEKISYDPAHNAAEKEETGQVANN